MRGIVFIIGTLLTLTCVAQDMEYARKVVDTLASPAMHGRGYAFEGDKKAAHFLTQEFQRHGLKSFGDDYQQEFPLTVNAFPGEMCVSVDGKTLEAGKDFQPDPNCKSVNKTYKVYWVDSLSLPKFLSVLKKHPRSFFDRFAVVLDVESFQDPQNKMALKAFPYQEGLNTKTVVFLRDEAKFTWTVGKEAEHFPVFSIKPEAIQKGTQKVKVNLESVHHKDYTGLNLVGYVPGTAYPDSFIVFSSHYDHLGRMGADAYIPGANDNASGTAMLLNLMQHYSQNPARYSIAFIAFGGEEVGLVGSKHYVFYPKFSLKKIAFLLNLDIMGTGDAGITVVNGTLHVDEFKRLTSINKEKEYLTKIKVRGKAANSDHYWFTQQGVSAFFIYTMGGIQAYHDIYDKAETLPLTAFSNVFLLLTDFVSGYGSAE